MLSNNKFLQEIQQKYQINIRTAQTKIFNEIRFWALIKLKPQNPNPSQQPKKKNKNQFLTAKIRSCAKKINSFNHNTKTTIEK